jgi:hypothetical protein
VSAARHPISVPRARTWVDEPTYAAAAVAEAIGTRQRWRQQYEAAKAALGWAGASGIRLCDDCGMSSDVFGLVLIVRSR